MDNQQLIETLKDFYSEFEAASLDKLDELYDDDVAFTDPIHQLVGLEDLKKYFEHTMENVEYCHFTFDDEAVSEQQAFMSWQMRFSHPKLADGMEIVLPGVSHIKFADGKIRSQQDYYDMGAMLYEHVPLVGYVVDKIKQRLVAE